MKITEGYMPYLGYQTYYRIAGECRDGKKPLLLLHGGPGSTHNYFEVLDALADTGRAVISYDQLGCGNSYVDGHPELWCQKTWDNELMELRRHLGLDQVHLLGQSWGGMLAIEYLCDYQPEGVASVILSSTLSSASLWAKEQHRMIRFLSQEDQEAIAEAERTGNFDTPEYLAANSRFMERHCDSPSADTPECVTRPKRSGKEAYLYGWGPNEYNPTGSLGSWEYTDKLERIKCPALIISGTNDLCTPLIAKTMYDRIPNARWELFDGCRHMCFVEDNEKYIRLLTEWLDQTEKNGCV
ncbi:proline iminopeptidase-family hydrolase [Faecalicatena contorta]|uniref:Proline iminopeptidase n=1 Tax=Faecalicatena fissicatena TaxID=290055 RepID=A0ABS2E534_9FIRM|nr:MULTISPECIES: proline iminopeptidase-family hydrolase [Clostridia]MBM6684219.1 proline iminopeptidase-family hydrolase [Faecalicatena contorta]MBM6709469.1 proline iminopeptidase-family hydrolase [Faecalicatena contorta]MBM6736724.1 proline iminopeptidase-family hydrolase [Faecalicatena fissicatena]HIX99918.1 proline iminopeptidase-family hydrolase [Candidatus Dorea intestinigallinarum]